MMASKYYAVKVGHTPGIYESWADCEAQTSGFSGAVYKSFKTEEEAKAWLDSSNDPETAPIFGETSTGSTKTEILDNSHEVDVTSRATRLSSDLDNFRNQIAQDFCLYLTGSVFEVAEVETDHIDYTRINFSPNGYADLYLTTKHMHPLLKRFWPKLTNEQKKELKRLWRKFVVSRLECDTQGQDISIALDRMVEKYRPFAHLNFDFIHLAKAIIDATDCEIKPEDIRFDLNRIEMLVKDFKESDEH